MFCRDPEFRKQSDVTVFGKVPVCLLYNQAVHACTRDTHGMGECDEFRCVDDALHFLSPHPLPTGAGGMVTPADQVACSCPLQF